jgi:hypothetical protein
MIGMGVPPIEPIGGAESSIWPAIITAIVFATLLVATIWTYLRNSTSRAGSRGRGRHAATLPREEEHQLLKAA